MPSEGQRRPRSMRPAHPACTFDGPCEHHGVEHDLPDAGRVSPCTCNAPESSRFPHQHATRCPVFSGRVSSCSEHEPIPSIAQEALAALDRLAAVEDAGRSSTSREACMSEHPQRGFRCGMPVGHSGVHQFRVTWPSS